MKIILKMLAYLANLLSDAPCANVTFSGTSSGYYFMLWKYGTVTLIVTCKDNRYQGIRAKNHNYNPNSNSNASALAATGYTGPRSARTDNSDGTYTWTYTVAPVTP